MEDLSGCNDEFVHAGVQQVSSKVAMVNFMNHLSKLGVLEY